MQIVSKIFKEMGVFVSVFLFLALGMHMKQWVSHPIEHMEKLADSHFGLFHPLYFSFGIYITLFLVRKIWSFISGLFSKKNLG